MIPLQNYSHYSLLDSILKPSQIVDVAKANGCTAAAITDTNSMAGIVQFWKAAKKEGIKPILGTTLKFHDGSTIVLLAENYNGYRNLLRILSDVNTEANYFRHCCVSIDLLAKHDTANIICLNGHYGSSIYSTVCPEDCVDDYYIDDLHVHMKDLIRCFPENNVYLQLEASFGKDVHKLYNDLSSTYGTHITSGNQIKYSESESSRYLFDVVRATKEKCLIKQLDPVTTTMVYEDLSFMDYTYNNEIERRIEEYDILSEPKLPSFPCPNGEKSIDFLTQLCRDGYRAKGIKNNDTRYSDRIKYELGVFRETGLADYFLILWDVVRYAENDGQLLGTARGSSAGCLVSYLLNITKIDPIEHELIFSRFYNEGRKGSMPDIDTDFPKAGRDKCIQYTVDKYGQDNVGQIVTYQTFMGRAAIKSVLKAEGDLQHAEINRITKNIEDKAKIADELQEMKEAGREPSVILWALENRARHLKDWVYLDDNDKICGPLAKEFENCIKLEGIKSAQSRHAAGVVVATDPLRESAPTLYDPKSKKQVVGLENEDAESVGLIKYDYLSLSTLDRIQDINN